MSHQFICRECLSQAYISCFHRLEKKGNIVLEKNTISKASKQSVKEAFKADVCISDRKKVKEYHEMKNKNKRATEEVSTGTETNAGDGSSKSPAAKKAKKSEGKDEEGDRPVVGTARSSPVEAPQPSTSAPSTEPRTYPPPAPRKGNVSLLLFYAYCKPQMTKGEKAPHDL